MRAVHVACVVLCATAGCLVGSGGPSEAVGTELTAERGIDYAWSRPSSPQALAAAGYTFVARYLSYDTTGKNLTASEAQDLFAAGIDVVANWEWGASDALDGYATGAAQARDALAQAQAAGMPADRPIYFSIDFDASPGQQPAIDSYFDGVASVLGVERTGAYAGYYVIQRLFDHGKIQWGWQTYAWSGGQWDARAQLRQIDNGVTVAGADCDIDQSAAADFGQWGPHAPAAAAPDEGSQAYLTPDQQHVITTTGSGELRHAFWDGATQSVQHETWGTGVTGRPVTFVDGDAQHAFARGTGGTLEHWYYTPAGGLAHDTWGSGLAGDPAAIVIGKYQDAWAIDAAGALQHWYWDPDANAIRHDTWGTGVAGRPSVLLYAGQQHVFARGTSGTLEHFWWDASAGIQHDTWGSGLAADPAALLVGEFQDVWAIDTAGALQHWWWGPSTGSVQHDTWGSGVTGRPSVMLAGAQQHAFARGTAGTLEHWWWDPTTGLQHDTWGSGLAGDPTAERIEGQQHVWAPDAAATLQHWYWDPATNVVAHDSWGS
ncbi:MAG: glycoside hydrolase domain-containing protein [Acidobacteriota bacterium]